MSGRSLFTATAAQEAAVERAVGSHELKEFETSGLDIACCHRLELVVGLTEFDGSPGHRFETWPEAVRVLMQRHLEQWRQEKFGIDLRAITTGVRLGSCVMVVHYDQK